MKSARLVLLLFFAIASLTAVAAEVKVFAAASLSDALKELGPRFTAATGHTLRFNFGASGALARQVKEGAPADVFCSADEARVDQLDSAGLLLPGTRRPLLANQLVLVVPADAAVAVAALSDLTKAEVRRIAIGEPATVPAGSYAKAYLEKMGLWKAVSVKVVPVETVRAVLAAVESGNVEAGFVYRTDALISKKVKIAIAVAVAEGPRIIYPAVVLKDAKSPEAARAWLDYLATPEARKIFASFGFLSPN